MCVCYSVKDDECNSKMYETQQHCTTVLNSRERRSSEHPHQTQTGSQVPLQDKKNVFELLFL